jgi:hypothetical protein
MKPRNPATPSTGERNGNAERPISLAPLDHETALAGLLAVPHPEATKPKNRKGR